MSEYKNGLTKENFWNDIKQKYPEALEHFCNWIDEYKKEIGWDTIFAPGIKFHDLPYDLQNGLIARFDLEKFNGKLKADKIMRMESMRIGELFADVQQAIIRREIKFN